MNVLEQFQVHTLFQISSPQDLNLALTNAGLVLTMTIITLKIVIQYLLLEDKIVPDNQSIFFELITDVVVDQIIENVGSKGYPYFGFMLTLFLSILLLNLFGLTPYWFPVTAEFIITMSMSLMVFMGVTMTGFMKNSTYYFQLFLPSGCPLMLSPLLVAMEFMSYFASALSLGLSLGANMAAGHLLLAVLAGFAVTLSTTLFFWAPILSIYILGFLEMAVCFIQAYVLSMLTCMYLVDALDPH